MLSPLKFLFNKSNWLHLNQCKIISCKKTTMDATNTIVPLYTVKKLACSTSVASLWKQRPFLWVDLKVARN